MEADWDLHAVVRGFSSISTLHSTPHVAQKVDIITYQEEYQPKCCSNSLAEELHELFTPYLLLEPPHTCSSVQPTISSYLAALEASKFRQYNQRLTATTADVADAPHNSQPTQKSKRRKFQLKKISHVSAEALSSDVWSWRKYGQKPIKGSPYPRGYYKCSSSKACFARKKVERNRSDPTMFTVTCTGEHNHPAPTHKNSLAGTTRNPRPILLAATSKPCSSRSMENMSPAGSADGMEDDINWNNLEKS